MARTYGWRRILLTRAHRTRWGCRRCPERPRPGFRFKFRIRPSTRQRSTSSRTHDYSYCRGGATRAPRSVCRCDNDQTAEKQLLRRNEYFEGHVLRRACGFPDLPAASQVAVTIDVRTGTLTLNFPPGAALADIAPLLQWAIRALFPLTEVFADAVVQVVGNRLLVLPGGEFGKSGSRSPTSSGSTDPTAERLKLTSEASTSNATLSGEHQTTHNPGIPRSGSPEVSRDGRRSHPHGSTGLPAGRCLAGSSAVGDHRAGVADGHPLGPLRRARAGPWPPIHRRIQITGKPASMASPR